MSIKGGLKPGQIGVTLVVPDPGAAARFYEAVFGARILLQDPVSPDDCRRFGLPRGTLSWVEMNLGGGHLYLTIENPLLKTDPQPGWPRTPGALDGTSAWLTLYVDDVDATVARALAAGAQGDGSDLVQDTHWGDRVAQFFDPFGHMWRVQTALEEVAYADLEARKQAMVAALRARTAR